MFLLNFLPFIDTFDFPIAGISHNLIKPTVGWDTDFEIIYVDGSLAVLVIDDSGSMGDAPAAMPIAISAAKQYVDLMEFGERVAVVGFDGSARDKCRQAGNGMPFSRMIF